MGKVVYAAAMSHVLFPDYYAKNAGPHRRAMVEELIAVVYDMGRDMLAAQPNALVSGDKIVLKHWIPRALPVPGTR